MNKIKKLWVENRVLFVLFIIVMICILLILGVFLNYFFGSSKSSYGNRLDGITEVQITDEMKNNFLNKMGEDESIIDKDLTVKGKVIYIRYTFKEGVTLIEAQSKALASLDLFEDKYKNFYDFNFTIKEESAETNEGFLLMGAKNANGSNLVWNNNDNVTNNEE